MKWLWLKDEHFTCIDDDDYERFKLMTFNLNTNGYARGYYDGRPTNLHCLIMDRVLAKDGLEIDHVNRAKWDNRKCNLRVITHSENLKNRGYPYNAPSPTELEKKNAVEHKTFTSRQNMLRRSKKVIRSDGIIFNSAYEASRLSKVDRSHISNCCNGREQSAGGYKWSFY